MRKILKQNATGFTLIETMVAVAIITIGFVSVLSLVNTSLSYISAIRNRLIAANLAAEGIEVIRNIRDSNWHQGLSWDSGLENGIYRVNYNSAPPLLADNGEFLLLSSSGLYHYYSGDPTPYKRRVSITTLPGGYEMRVVSEVTWKVRNITYMVSAEDHLFNWK